MRRQGYPQRGMFPFKHFFHTNPQEEEEDPMAIQCFKGLCSEESDGALYG